MEQLIVTEFKNLRVLTTQQLADSYETNEKVISNNFNRNKERYQEGKHYIALEGEEKREFLNHHQIEDGLKNATKIYLWSEKGAFLHAKSLNTDKAWEVYDKLVDSYFKARKPLSALEQIKLQNEALIEVNEKVDEVKNDLEVFKRDLPLLGLELDKIKNARNRKIVPLLGGKNSQAYNDRSLRDRVYKDSANQIWREFGVGSFKEIKRCQCDLVIKIIDKYELPYALEEEIKDCNSQEHLHLKVDKP